MKPKILVTREIPSPAIRRMEDVFDVIINPFPRNMTACELKNAIKDCDAIISMLSDIIDEELIKSARNLRVISNYAVGYNNIDLVAAKARGIRVCNTAGVLTETTADLTWALLLASARRLIEADTVMRKGEFEGWEPLALLGNDIYAKTLGIIGMGRIGQAVAKRSIGFSMKILYSGNPKELPFPAENVGLEELLKRSDFVSIHTPLTPNTHHLIGAKELELMKPSSILVNTARGAIIDEAALVSALRTKQIAGAGLDVYEFEPQITEGLKELTNVVLAPHIGSASIDTRTKMGLLAAENAIAVIEGKAVPSLVQ